jgi:hypothetical protein
MGGRAISATVASSKSAYTIAEAWNFKIRKPEPEGWLEMA